jgi:hypothetical protein
VGRLFAERKELLIEITEDTTQPDSARRAGLIELSIIESIRLAGRRRAAGWRRLPQRRR